MTDIREDHSKKLLTEAQRTKLVANGTRRGADHKPVVKWFNTGGAGTWLLSELDPEYPDECGFGLADLGFGTPELGSIGLLELTERLIPLHPVTQYEGGYAVVGWRAGSGSRKHTLPGP